MTGMMLNLDEALQRQAQMTRDAERACRLPAKRPMSSPSARGAVARLVKRLSWRSQKSPATTRHSAHA